MDNWTFVIFLYLIWISSNFYVGALEIFDFCSDENDICLELKYCSHIHEAVKNGYRPQICSFIGTEPVVCCVTNINSQNNHRNIEYEDKRIEPETNYEEKYGGEENKEQRISARMCEKYQNELCPSSTPYVIGGIPALPRELPFMARIGYGSEREKTWNCGGSLISPRYVLSAAHCETFDKVPKWVVLGDLDFSTYLEDARPQEFTIVQRHTHPKYKSFLSYNDIALYKLDRNAILNEYVRPICLNQIPNLRTDTIVSGAGWGATEFENHESKYSSKLLKVDLQMFPKETCYRDEYWRILPNGFHESLLCAGSSEGRKDTCIGDSGGPLYIKPDYDLLKKKCFLFTQVGITSFGKQCGLPDYPAVYTDVNYFLPWIESIVWPRESTSSNVDYSRVWK